MLPQLRPHGLLFPLGTLLGKLEGRLGSSLGPSLPLRDVKTVPAGGGSSEAVLGPQGSHHCLLASDSPATALNTQRDLPYNSHSRLLLCFPVLAQGFLLQEAFQEN